MGSNHGSATGSRVAPSGSRVRAPTPVGAVGDLTPPLLLLRRLHVPRAAVIMVVSFAFSIIFALGWILSQQATGLAENFPRYQHALSDKIATLRNSTTSSGFFEKASNALKGLQDELSPPRAAEAEVV